MSNLLELNWEFDSEGYDVLDGQGEDSAHVVSRGGPPTYYKCKADDFEVLRDLIGMPATREGVLGFVGQWGLLAPASGHEFQLVSTFIVLKYSLEEILHKGLAPYAGGQILASLDLVYGPTRGFSLRANSLLGFLFAQATLQYKEGAIFQCPICKKFALRKAPRGATPKKKLGRAPMYCSGGCKAKAYRQGLKADRQ